MPGGLALCTLRPSWLFNLLKFLKGQKELGFGFHYQLSTL